MSKNPYRYMISDVFATLFIIKVLLQEVSEFVAKLLNFGMARLKLGRWAEKEVACEKLSDHLEQNFKNK